MTVVAGRPTGWSTEAADAVLATWVGAGVLGDVELHLVSAVLRLAPDRPDDAVLLALALTARATRLGHVCLDLARRPRPAGGGAGRRRERRPASTCPIRAPGGPSWPGPPIVADAGAEPPPDGSAPLRPLVLDGGRLYLQRYWSFEVAVPATCIGGATGAPPSAAPTPGSAVAVRQACPRCSAACPDDEDGSATSSSWRRSGRSPARCRSSPEARAPARPTPSPGSWPPPTCWPSSAASLAPGGAGRADRQGGGPDGRGRRGAGAHPRRRGPDRCRGGRPPARHHPVHHPRPARHRTRTSFRHDRTDPLVHDLVVVDETSMVSLPLLARLLDAVRPEARLVLVGDPFQLASIEAGTVMGDLVGPEPDDGSAAAVRWRARVTELRRGHRFDAGSATADLALAIRDGDADAVLDRLAAGDAEVHWVRPDDGPRPGRRCRDSWSRPPARWSRPPSPGRGRRRWPPPPGSRCSPPSAGVRSASTSGPTGSTPRSQASCPRPGAAGGPGSAHR